MAFLNWPIKMYISKSGGGVFTTRVSLRHTTVFTYSHTNTPLGQSELVYDLSYFINFHVSLSHWHGSTVPLQTKPSMDPLHGPIKICLAGGQATHWDIQNKEKSRSGWWKSLCFGECCILLPSSMVDFVPCDGIMQRAHWDLKISCLLRLCPIIVWFP